MGGGQVSGGADDVDGVEGGGGSHQIGQKPGRGGQDVGVRFALIVGGHDLPVVGQQGIDIGDRGGRVERRRAGLVRAVGLVGPAHHRPASGRGRAGRNEHQSGDLDRRSLHGFRVVLDEVDGGGTDHPARETVWSAISVPGAVDVGGDALPGRVDAPLAATPTSTIPSATASTVRPTAADRPRPTSDALFIETRLPPDTPT